MPKKNYDGVGTKLLKIFSVLGATVMLVPTLFSLGLGKDQYSFLLIIFLIGFPIISSYFWINDSKKGKFFYAAIMPIFLILGFFFILMIVLGGFSSG